VKQRRRGGWKDPNGAHKEQKRIKRKYIVVISLNPHHKPAAKEPECDQAAQVIF
jgi:hypothetical protein